MAALIRQNTLMGLPDELQLTIIAETLGPAPSIPLTIFTSQALLTSSILGPFKADAHLYAMALETCHRDSIFTTTFAELQDPDAIQISPDVFANIRHLRIVDPEPLPAD